VAVAVTVAVVVVVLAAFVVVVIFVVMVAVVAGSTARHDTTLNGDPTHTVQAHITHQHAETTGMTWSNIHPCPRHEKPTRSTHATRANTEKTTRNTRQHTNENKGH
jgi:hypothetical protein